MGSIKIPAASLSTFNTISIIVLVPVYDKLFLPALRACGIHITMLQRIGWGQVIAIFAMLSAAWVEYVRLGLAKDGRFVVGEGENAVDMAVWYQTPQYILVGLSEVFASIGQLEFFYNQAPGAVFGSPFKELSPFFLSFPTFRHSNDNSRLSTQDETKSPFPPSLYSPHRYAHTHGHTCTPGNTTSPTSRRDAQLLHGAAAPDELPGII